jgi:GTPase SAR1 family protein
MPSGIDVDNKVFKLLFAEYNNRYEGTANRKSDCLFSELENKYGKGKSPVGKRTIQNFFSSQGDSSATYTTLDCLVDFLLDYKSYIDVYSSIYKKDEYDLDDPAYDDYWNYVLDRVKYVKIPNRSRPINIDEVYVFPEFSDEISSKISRKLPDYSLLDFSEFDVSADKQLKPEKAYLFKNIFNQKNQRLVIFGGAGAGKTSLLKKVTHDVAKGKGYFNSRNSEAYPNLGIPLLPIYISLRDLSFNSIYVRNGDFSIINFIRDEIQSHFKDEGDFDDRVVENLKRGNALILMDALDEVSENSETSDKNNLKKVIANIRLFLRNYPLCRCIITSRFGSDEFSLEELGFFEYEILDFGRAKLFELARSYFTGSNDGNANLSYFRQVISNVKKGSISPNLLDGIVTNPLMATMLFEIFSNGSGLPQNKYELFEMYVETLLNKWDASRRIYRNKVNQAISYRFRMDILSEIALDGLWPSRNSENVTNEFDSPGQKVVWHIQELVDIIRLKFDALVENQDEAIDVIKSFEEDDCILIRTEFDRYEFRHITFQAFFAAYRLANDGWNSDNKKDVKRALQIANKTGETNWDLVVIFLVGRLRSSNILLKSLFENTLNIARRDSNIVAFLEWLESRIISSGYSWKDSSWRAFYTRVDLDTDLFINAADQGLDQSRAIMQKISVSLQQFRKWKQLRQGVKVITLPTLESKLELRLAALHSRAVLLVSQLEKQQFNSDENACFSNDKGSEINVAYIDKEVLRKEIRTIRDIGEYLANSDASDNYIIPLINQLRVKHTECENFDLSTQVVEKFKSFASVAMNIDSDDLNAIKSWANEFQIYIKEKFNIGENRDMNPENLKDYLFSVNVLLECLLSDMTVKKELRENMLDRLFLSPSSIYSDPDADKLLLTKNIA